MFIAAPFIITKNWKQLKCPSIVNDYKETVVHTYNGKLLSNKKE